MAGFCNFCGQAQEGYRTSDYSGVEDTNEEDKCAGVPLPEETRPDDDDDA